VNERQKLFLFDKMKAYYDGDLSGKVIALWGLAFKPNTDDMREASSRALMEALWKEGASVKAFDPVAKQAAYNIYGDRKDLWLCDTPEEALEGADCLAIVTEWSVFQSPHFALMKKTLKSPVIFDGRNLYDPAYLKKRGFTYFAIGRGTQLG